MFLYTKYFLVFLSLSVLSPMCAMDPNNVKDIEEKNVIVLRVPPDGSYPECSILESSSEKIEERKQIKDINDHSEKEQLQNIKNLLLKDFNADPNLFTIGSEKTPVICVAAEHNDMELIKLLLERGADINANGFLGNTALSRAVSKGNNFLCEYLLQKGANPNPSGCIITPLDNAILNNDASAIKSLIHYSANVDVHTANKFVGDAYTNFNLKKEYYPYIKTVLLVLRRICNRVLYENDNLRFLILSCLPEYHCHQGLYKELQNRKYALKPFTLHVVDGHIKIVQDILQVKNKDNKNILELFPSITKLNEKLLSDAAEFKEKYLDMSAITKDNLALEILKRYAFKYELLIPEDILSKKDKMLTSVF